MRSIIGACIHNLLIQQLYDILKCFDINDLPGLDRFCKHNENIYLVPIYISQIQGAAAREILDEQHNK